MNSIEKAFCDNLSKLNVNFEKDKIVIAFSGGADSLALLVLLSKTIPLENVIPVYVNHKIRKQNELKKEIELNKLNCKKLGLELSVIELEENEVFSYKGKKHCGLEAAARFLRYKNLENIREKSGANYIATAHHKDDLIETVFIKYKKGAPLPALRGIADKKDTLLRPLLNFSKNELISYLELNNFTFSFDSTNKDNNLERNYYRNIVIPSEKKKNPNFDEDVLNLRKHAFEVCENAFFVSHYKLSLDIINAQTYEMNQVTLLSLWDYVLGEKELPIKLIDRVLKEVEKGQTKVISANGGTFEINRGFLYLTSDVETSSFSSFSREVNLKENNDFIFKNFRFVSGIFADNFEVKKEDLFLVPDLYVLRFAKSTDSIVLKDGKKTLFKLLQDQNIPSTLRCRVPVLEKDGKIQAVYSPKKRISVEQINKGSVRCLIFDSFNLE